jgi:hypothetical protein
MRTQEAFQQLVDQASDGISAMAWKLISGFGTTMVGIKWPKANPKPIQLKPIMPSYVII